MNDGNGAAPAPAAEMIRVPRGGGGMVARQGATSNEIEMTGETASAAIAEKARAQVEARFVVAQRFPRDLKRVRDKLLAACARPGFAEVAIYHKPIGEGIEGPSIRMAEEAARAMGNIDTSAVTIYDDQYKRIIEVSATDLEANLTYPVTITIEKTVERRKANKGQTIRYQRVNSYGDPVYIVDATDDEILNKVASLVSKALRTVLLRLVPGDILEEAMEKAYAVRREMAEKDIEGARAKMIAAFDRLSVRVDQIAAYLGHAVSDVTMDELERLRGLFNAIKDGEATWQEVTEREQRAGEKPATAAQSAQPTGNPPPAQSEQPKADTAKRPPANLNEAAQRARSGRRTEAASPPPPTDPQPPTPPSPPPPGAPEPDWAKDDDDSAPPKERVPGEEG